MTRCHNLQTTVRTNNNPIKLGQCNQQRTMLGNSTRGGNLYEKLSFKTTKFYVVKTEPAKYNFGTNFLIQIQTMADKS